MREKWSPYGGYDPKTRPGRVEGTGSPDVINRSGPDVINRSAWAGEGDSSGSPGAVTRSTAAVERWTPYGGYDAINRRLTMIARAALSLKIYVHINVYLNISACIYVDMFIDIFEYICLYSYIYTYIHPYTFIYITCIFVYVIYLFISRYICIQIYSCTYVHIYTRRYDPKKRPATDDWALMMGLMPDTDADDMADTLAGE